MTANDLASISDPEKLRRFLVVEFPEIAEESAMKTQRGGRSAGLAALHRVKPQAYERSRNFLNGEVTRLSPYLRHGVLTLAEVRDFALEQVKIPDEAGKFINELGWRDYWQRLYAQPYSVKLRSLSYTPHGPARRHHPAERVCSKT